MALIALVVGLFQAGWGRRVAFGDHAAEREAAAGGGCGAFDVGWSGREAGPQAKAKARFGAKHSRRPDALGASGHERVEARGCGRSADWRGSAARLRAHVQRPHLKRRWRICARRNAGRPCAGDDRRQKLGENGRALRRSSDHGFSFGEIIGSSGAPAAHKLRMLRGIVEADETFRPRILQGPVVRSAAQGAQTRRNGPIRASTRATSPFSSSATGKARLSTRSCLRSTASGPQAALAGVVTPGNHLIGDGGEAIAAFARKARIPFHAVPSPTAEVPCESLLMQPWQPPRPGVQAASEVRIG